MINPAVMHSKVCDRDNFFPHLSQCSGRSPGHHVIVVARQYVQPPATFSCVEDELLSGCSYKIACLRWTVLTSDMAQHNGCSCIGERAPMPANLMGKEKIGAELLLMCLVSSSARSSSLWMISSKAR
eukprot:272787-Ditylum_brightwellii.AAC.1